jgi:hypothetical protein
MMHLLCSLGKPHNDTYTVCVSWAKGPCNVVLCAVTLGVRVACDVCLNCVKAVNWYLLAFET